MDRKYVLGEKTRQQLTLVLLELLLEQNEESKDYL